MLTGSSQGTQFLHKLLRCKFLVQSLYLLTPCYTRDSAVHILTYHYDLELLLVGRGSWEMSIGVRPCLCSLGTFYGFFHHHGALATFKSSIENFCYFCIKKPPFAPNFISQLCPGKQFFFFLIVKKTIFCFCVPVRRWEATAKQRCISTLFSTPAPGEERRRA